MVDKIHLQKVGNPGETIPFVYWIIRAEWPGTNQPFVILISGIEISFLALEIIRFKVLKRVRATLKSEYLRY